MLLFVKHISHTVVLIDLAYKCKYGLPHGEGRENRVEANEGDR